MQRPQNLLAALFLGIAFAPHSGATVYPSDGSEANVQAINDTNAHGPGSPRVRSIWSRETFNDVFDVFFIGEVVRSRAFFRTRGDESRAHTANQTISRWRSSGL